MNISLRHTLLLIGLIAVPMSLWAQDDDLAAPSKALERVEQFKKIRMMEVLALDEQTSIRFFARYGKHQRLLQELRRKQMQSLGKVQSLRKTKAGDAEYARVIQELQSLEGESQDAKMKYIEELKDILSNKQIAEYLVFEMRFQQNLRELIRETQKNRPNPLKF